MYVFPRIFLKIYKPDMYLITYKYHVLMNSEHVIKLIQFTIKTYNNSPHILRHALFKHFMSNERAFRNKLRSGHPTCQKLICDMRSMTARQHDSMTA